MREPQVDTFCRCVKKVKKTLKAEGRAIAICTKSVLQTKGRTLRKVRCRDHLLETQPMKAGRKTRIERKANNERNETHVVYVKDDTVKTPVESERIMGLPVGQASALSEICKVQGNETIDAKYLTKVPHSAALILFFGKKHEAHILRAKHPLGNLPIEKAKGFAIVNFNGDDLELDALCAHESTRGMGVGANTLKYIETMATLNGKKRVLLDALPGAVPFYVKQGYAATQRDNFYTKELVPQEGGVFKWAGADTPVFNKETKGGWNGFPIMLMPQAQGSTEEQKAAAAAAHQTALNALITKYGAVVRMVSAGDGEIPIHRMLKDMIDAKVAPFDSLFVKLHINLWAGNGIYRVDPVATKTMVNTHQAAEQDKITKLDRIMGRFGPYKWYGLVTRTQKVDVAQLIGRERINALCGLLRVLLRIDGRIVHYDLHHGNMAIMQDGTPVIHDVGRMKIRDVAASFAPWEVGRPGTWNKRILRNVLMPIFEWPNYNMDYGQYFYIARLFRDLRKKGEAPFVFKEVFPSPTAPEWVRNDISPVNEYNKKAFEAWLDESSGPGGDKLPQRQVHINWVKAQTGLRVYDASGNVVTNPTAAPGPFFYLDPPTETRYHQIARVFDILSVLKALAWHMRDGSVAFYYARKTAVKIIGLLTKSPPEATKLKVGDAIRGYLELTGTRNNYGGNTPALEDTWATKYLDEVNYARSGKKESAMSAAEKAAKAAADAEAAVVAARAAAAAAHARDEAARVALGDANAKMAAAKKAAEDAEAAVVAARAAAVAAGAEAGEAIEVGAPPQPDALNDAVGSEAIIAELNAVHIPIEMALDEAVAEVSEIVRESEDTDNSKVLIEKGMILSPKDVEAEAEAEDADAGAAPPDIKRLRDFPLAEAVEGKLDLSSPLTGVDYVVGPDGKAKPVVPEPPTDGRQEGGVYRSGGTAAVTFEAHDGSWGFLPPPTDPAAATAAVQAIKPAPSPASIVAYISSDPGIKEKHDTVKSSAAYAPYALTYVASYKCNLQALVDTPTTVWSRDEKGRLNRTPVVHFPGGLPWRPSEVLGAAIYLNPGGALCLLIPKFKGTVANLAAGDASRAMIQVLVGLCVPRDFVICDLHVSNMAVMPGPDAAINGRAVTFDYDRLRRWEEFGGLFSTILEKPDSYIDLPQYDHVMKLGPAALQTYAVKPDKTFFVNYDLLSVLSSLKFMCSKVYEDSKHDTVRAVDTCMIGISTAPDAAAKKVLVETLGRALEVINGGANAADYMGDFTSDEEVRGKWNKWKEDRDAARAARAAPPSGNLRKNPPQRARYSPVGGRRTPRRKGLPQLL